MEQRDTTGRRPLLSLCMIVKDEEKLLARALASARDWVDEMVVVDTGSRDATVQVARDLGARVFQDPWQNDFARHRNRSLELARGQWVLILDADEELDQDQAPRLRQALAHSPEQGFLLRVLNHLPGGHQSARLAPRLFRNLPHLRFEGRYPERLPQGADWPRLEVTIIHHGYALDTLTMARKAQGRLELVNQWVAAEPDNFMAHLHLASTLLAAFPGSEKKALDHGLTAFQLVQQSPAPREQWPRVLHIVLVALSRLGLDQELYRMARVCQDLFPTWPDPLLAQVLAAQAMERWQDVCRAARRFLALQECWSANPWQYPHDLNTTLGRDKEALYHWCLAAARLGLTGEVLQVFRRLEAEPGSRELAQSVLDQLREWGLFSLADRMAGRPLLSAAGA